MAKRVFLPLAMMVLFMATVAFALETKDISIPVKNADPVLFSHKIHLAKYHNNCKMCHDTIYSLRDRKRFTMAEMEKGKSCGACHTGIKAFSVATEKDCANCHKGKPRDVVYKIKGLGDTVFSHATHIAKVGGTCKSCHNGKVITGKEKAVSMAEMETGKTCGACHNGKSAFTVAGNCDKCHKGVKTKDITFTLKGTSPATFSHGFHLQAYKCDDCHTKLFPYRIVVGKASMADMDKGKSCGACHNGKDAFASNSSCDKCHKGGIIPGVITYKIPKPAGPAAFNHQSHLKTYKCGDCHTKIFPFRAGTIKASMADMELSGISCGACHNKGKAAFTVDECIRCHAM